VADAFEPRVPELLRAFPSMPATVIAERVGWPYSVRTLSGKVAERRPAYLPPDPASRTSYAAGEISSSVLTEPVHVREVVCAPSGQFITFSQLSIGLAA
jgi:hypothetical protein